MRVTLMDMLIVITRECVRLTKMVTPIVNVGLGMLAVDVKMVNSLVHSVSTVSVMMLSHHGRQSNILVGIYEVDTSSGID